MYTPGADIVQIMITFCFCKIIIYHNYQLEVPSRKSINACAIIDYIYINIYKNNFISIYSILKMQGIEKWPYLLIYCRIQKEKVRKRGKQTV